MHRPTLNKHYKFIFPIQNINKIKTIIIGPAYPLRGGIANFNEALCSAINASGGDCHIVSFSLQYPGFLFPGTTQMAEGDTPPDGVKVLTKINSLNPVSWLQTANYIRQQKPSRVIIRYWLPFMAPCLGTIARLVKRGGSGIKVIAIADNVIPHEARPGDSALTRYFVNSCDAFMVMSQSVLNDLKKFDRSKPIVFNPHPIYDIFGERVGKIQARKQLGLDESGRYVLFFGFVRKYKGLDLLLRAFANDKVKALQVKLVVAGEFYDDKSPYTELIDELGIIDHVILHDRYIPKEGVKFYFGASDLVAQPYRDATQSGVTQIAYHFEKPMLVTNVGGLPEIVPNGIAGYVTDTTPESISSAIIDYFENNREAEFTEGVKRNAHRFSWSQFVTNLLGL